MGLHPPAAHAWNDLAMHLRGARVGQGVSQEFLAHWIGIDRRTIARIENGNPRMSVAHLSAMELALALQPGSSLEILARGSRYRATLVDPSEQPTLCGHTPPCR